MPETIRFRLGISQTVQKRLVVNRNPVFRLPIVRSLVKALKLSQRVIYRLRLE